jgi:hypothetical protein
MISPQMSLLSRTALYSTLPEEAMKLYVCWGTTLVTA